MSVLFVVLPLAVLFSALAVVAFLWSTRSGQLDDLETPPLRILGDDAAVRASAKATACTGLNFDTSCENSIFRGGVRRAPRGGLSRLMFGTGMGMGIFFVTGS